MATDTPQTGDAPASGGEAGDGFTEVVLDDGRTLTIDSEDEAKRDSIDKGADATGTGETNGEDDMKRDIEQPAEGGSTANTQPPATTLAEQTEIDMERPAEVGSTASADPDPPTTTLSAHVSDSGIELVMHGEAPPTSDDDAGASETTSPTSADALVETKEEWDDNGTKKKKKKTKKEKPQKKRTMGDFKSLGPWDGSSVAPNQQTTAELVTVGKDKDEVFVKETLIQDVNEEQLRGLDTNPDVALPVDFLDLLMGAVDGDTAGATQWVRNIEALAGSSYNFFADVKEVLVDLQARDLQAFAFALFQNETTVSPMTEPVLRLRVRREHFPKGTLADSLPDMAKSASQRLRVMTQLLLAADELQQLTGGRSLRYLTADAVFVTSTGDVRVNPAWQAFRLVHELWLVFAAKVDEEGVLDLIPPAVFEVDRKEEDEEDPAATMMWHLGVIWASLLEGKDMHSEFARIRRRRKAQFDVDDLIELLSLDGHLRDAEVTDLSVLLGLDREKSVERAFIDALMNKHPQKRLPLRAAIRLLAACEADEESNSLILVSGLDALLAYKGEPISDEELVQLKTKFNPQHEPERYERPQLSKTRQLIQKRQYILLATLLAATIGVVSADLATSERAEDLGEVIGFMLANMALSAVLSFAGLMGLIRTWATPTWWINYLTLYALHLFIVFLLADEFPSPLLELFIVFGVVKILNLYMAFLIARVDSKFFMPSYIHAVLTLRFLKLSGLVRLLPWFAGVLTLQGALFTLLVVALGGPTEQGSLRIVAYVFAVWVVNIGRHFLSYTVARVMTLMLDGSEPADVVRTAMKTARQNLATIALGSFLTNLSPFFSFMSTFMLYAKRASACLSAVCFATGEAAETTRRRKEDDDGCCFFAVAAAAAVLAAVSWVGEKVFKAFLSVASKLIMPVAAGVLGEGYWTALGAFRKAHKREKEELGGPTRMLLLDNGMAATVTNLAILASSLGCWIALSAGASTAAALLVWVAGYSACRTVLELADTLLQLSLILWHIRPDLLAVLDPDMQEKLKQRNAEFAQVLDPSKDREGEDEQAGESV